MTTPIAPSGDITYNNVSFDELEIKWKAKPACKEAEFTALSAWMNDNTAAIPAGSARVTWPEWTVVGTVGLSLDGSTITLPAGYAYKLRSDLAINKPTADETNVFYDVDSQWVVTTEGADSKVGCPGNNSCAGTGAQEVRNRAALPAVAYIEAASDTTVSLEITHSDQPLHIAKGSQIHIEVLGIVSTAEKKVGSNQPAKPKFPWAVKK